MRALALALIAAAMPAAAQDAGDWRRMASDADRARLREWRTAWTRGLAAVPGARRRDILFDPDGALQGAMPPPGSYRCRLHRLGGTAVVATWQPCRVEAVKGQARFVVEGGTHRPAGHLYADTDARAIFLGSLMIGDERRAMRYGRDRLRDLAGLVERVGRARWRLVMPDTSYGAAIDLIELVPA